MALKYHPYPSFQTSYPNSNFLLLPEYSTNILSCMSIRHSKLNMSKHKRFPPHLPSRLMTISFLFFPIGLARFLDVILHSFYFSLTPYIRLIRKSSDFNQTYIQNPTISSPLPQPPHHSLEIQKQHPNHSMQKCEAGVLHKKERSKVKVQRLQ